MLGRLTESICAHVAPLSVLLKTPIAAPPLTPSINRTTYRLPPIENGPHRFELPVSAKSGLPKISNTGIKVTPRTSLERCHLEMRRRYSEDSAERLRPPESSTDRRRMHS